MFIDLYGGGSSHKISKYSGAEYKLGYPPRGTKKTFYSFIPDEKTNLHAQWAQDHGRLLKPFGVEPKDLRAGTTFIPSPYGIEKAKELMACSDKSWILVNLGASISEKIWPTEDFVSIAKWLVEEYDYHLGVFINPDKPEIASKFSELCKQKNILQFSLLDVPDLNVIGGLMSLAKYIITGDTGLLHIAFGVKAPCVALFTYTRPEWVEPEDSLCLSCFVEHPNQLDPNGLKTGGPIPLELVKSKIIELEEKM